MEVYKDIKGWEGLYQISNKGCVKSLYGKGRILKNQVNKHRNNYCSVYLYSKNKQSRYKIHRLVAEAFLNNPENKPQVNHKDGNTTNNNLDNLEWCSASDNNKHKYRVLKSKPVRPRLKPVRVLRNGLEIGRYDSTREAAYHTNSDPSAVVKVCKKKYKQTNNLVFEYIGCGS